MFEENSCLYLFGRATFATRGRIGIDPFLFPIERREAIDIDEEIDFQMAEQLHRLERETLADGPR